MIDSSDETTRAEIELEANGKRRNLEAWYLEVKQLAKQYGFEVEFAVSKDIPEQISGRK